MSTRTLIIHSGTYKTGSSSLQLFLGRSQAYGGLEGTGFSYPKVGRAGAQHSNLVGELRGWEAHRPSAGSWDDILTDIEQGEAHTAIVSSEHFAGITREHMGTINALVAGRGLTVRWVHYLRDQPALLNALFIERLVGMRPEFAAHFDRPIEEFREWNPLGDDLFDYHRFALNIQQSIPGVDLVLRPFARSELVGNDVVTDFCAHVGLDVDTSTAESTNVSSGWRTVEAARRISPLISTGRLRTRSLGAENPVATRQRWLQYIRTELVTAATELGWNDTSANFVSPAFRAQLLEEFYESNVAVGEIGGFDFAGIAAAAKEREVNVGDFAEVNAEELMQVITRVMRVVRDMPEEIRNQVGRKEAPAPARLPQQIKNRVLRPRWRPGAR